MHVFGVYAIIHRNLMNKDIHMLCLSRVYQVCFYINYVASVMREIH